MKKYFYIFIALLSLPYMTNAQESGILGGVKGNDNGSATERIRTGDLHIEDIPSILTYVIDFGMGIAGTIAVLFVIIGAYRILFGALSQDKTKGKETIIMAVTGFVIAALSWFIIRIVIDNL